MVGLRLPPRQVQPRMVVGGIAQNQHQSWAGSPMGPVQLAKEVKEGLRRAALTSLSC
jgi:hypothetical protein